jgi:hypothetical protein
MLDHYDTHFIFSFLCSLARNVLYNSQYFSKTSDYTMYEAFQLSGNIDDIFHFCTHNFTKLSSRDSSVGIATAYGLDDGGVGVRVPVGLRIFSSPRCSDRLGGPPSLPSNGYRGLFARG